MIFWHRNNKTYHKEKARVIVAEKVNYFNSFYGFKFNRVSIKNNKSRWGSCSSKKNLNFNYKLVFLDENLINYLIVHELCHLKEMNHSKNFWRLVSQTIPDYKTLNKKLKKTLIH